jgi:uncharacterized protein GlcG (DUF336 family)
MTIVQRSTLSDAGARRLLEAAQDHARQLDHPFSIAVVDESGVLKAFTRMDGAILMSGQIALDKAYTAAGFGMPSAAWRSMFSEDGVLAHAASTGIDRLVAIPGGLPVLAGAAAAGAIGVSGGTAEMDAEVAQAAVDALEPAIESGATG